MQSQVAYRGPLSTHINICLCVRFYMIGNINIVIETVKWHTNYASSSRSPGSNPSSSHTSPTSNVAKAMIANKPPRTPLHTLNTTAPSLLLCVGDTVDVPFVAVGLVIEGVEVRDEETDCIENTPPPTVEELVLLKLTPLAAATYASRVSPDVLFQGPT